MDQLRDLAIIIALLSVSALSVYLIVTLIRVRDILNQIEHDVKEVSAKALPVLDNLEVITTRIKNVTENIEEQIEVVGHTIRSIRGITDNVVDFQQRLQEKVQEPVFEALNVLSAMVRGIRGLVERVRG